MFPARKSARGEKPIDLHAANLIVTIRGGANLLRPIQACYRGVQGQGACYRSGARLAGYDRVLSLYDTPEEAAQARDAAIIRLGLQDIAHLNNP